MIIDEFDGIPQDAIRGFLAFASSNLPLWKDAMPAQHRHRRGSKALRNSTTIAPSLPLIYKTSSKLPNFTLEQVQELFSQYTDEVGQPITPETLQAIHKQTAGQPVLVNRFAQILTEEMDIPKSESRLQ